MKNTEVKVIDNRAAYYFRKGVIEQESKAHLRDRVANLSNRNLMYGIAFLNRLN